MCARQEALLFEQVQVAADRRGRRAEPFGDLGDAEASVLRQLFQDQAESLLRDDGGILYATQDLTSNI